MTMKRIGLAAVGIFIILLSCTEDPISPVTTGTIEGTVTDATSSAPVVGASITTSPATSAVLTDNSGHFSFTDMEKGIYTLKASKSGYRIGSVSVTVKVEKTTNANIILTPDVSENHPPSLPSNPFPANSSLDQPLSLTLKWSCSDPDGDSLFYDLYFGSSSASIHLLSSGKGDTTFLVENLSYSTVYHWQIAAKDINGAITYGPIWSFETKSFPNNRILFASHRGGNYDIYSASEQGETIVQLTHSSARDWWPRLNPVLDKIAFTSDRDVESQIYLMNRDGTDVKIVTTLSVSGFNNYGTGFCWSPDGYKLLYSHYEGLYQINWDGSNLVQISTAPAGRHFRDCAWSSPGNKIVVQTIGEKPYSSELYLMDSDGSNMTLLIGDLPGALGHPSFSPDGNKIVYYNDVSGYEVNSGRMLDAHIFLLSIDGSDTTDISTNKAAGTNDTDPVWSPDGANIIFTNVRNDNSEHPDIWIMDIDGNNRTKLIENGMMPDWR